MSAVFTSDVIERFKEQKRRGYSDHQAARHVFGWSSTQALDLQQLEIVNDLLEVSQIVDPVKTKDLHDPVNHPSHYTQYQGLEIIDLVEQMNFNLGNAVKYITRAGFKDAAKTIEDLEKAVWYARREIERLKKASSADPR